MLTAKIRDHPIYQIYFLCELLYFKKMALIKCKASIDQIQLG